MRTLTRILIAAIVLPALVLTAAACDDAETVQDDTATQASIAELSARVQRNEMITATLTLATLPLHDIDEAIAAGEVPSNVIPTMRTVIRMANLTNWSDDLQTDATAVHDNAEALIAALESDDLDAAKEHATAVHEGAHDFTANAWDALAPATGGEGHPAETPVASQTPEAEATP